MVSSSEKIRELAEPILCSVAFARLDQISFLGILSPRYRTLEKFPFPELGDVNDGSRADHSVDVASVVLDVVSALGFSAAVKKYAVAWGLTHDIATWSLSHTGEAGFSDATKMSSRDLRRAMIEGAHWLPESLTVYKQLKEMAIEPDVLLALIDNDSAALAGDLGPLGALIHSPLTPDSLEGMWRSGLVFGVDVPRPTDVIASFYRDLFVDVGVHQERSSAVLHFWRAKSEVYSAHINLLRSIEFESAWSRAIGDCHWHLSLIDSLLLSEGDLISNVLTRGTPRFRDVRKYKPPLTYGVTPELSGKRKLNRNMKIQELRQVLTKEERKI